MKKVIFFTQNRWAFGSVHNGLCKELYKFDILANIFDWTRDYTPDEISMISDSYDMIVTNPEFAGMLLLEYNVPANKIIAVAHAQWDILYSNYKYGLSFLKDIKDYAVISNILKVKSYEFGCPVIPKIVKYGLHFDLFYNKPSSQLKNVGYAGIKKTFNFYNQEIKRGNLSDLAIKLSGLNAVNNNNYNFLCMPTYYKNIDAVIMSSTEEGGGLPMMEGAAAGKLCIGTPVGYFEENADLGGGITVPLDTQNFLLETSNTLLFYKNNPEEYYKKCVDIQEYARYNYDWSAVIDQWVSLLRKNTNDDGRI